MNNLVISFIGAGNMATSLIGGLLKTGFKSSQLWATDPSEQKLAQLKQRYQINTSTDNQYAVKQADIVILAVKPQVLAKVAVDLHPTIDVNKPLIISIAAGINLKHLQQWLGEGISIVRTMPNTPALVSCGATGMFANQWVTPQQQQFADQILKAVGITVWLANEGLMDIVTALSGSGPAYFFLMMEALINGAEQLGLPRDIAQQLTIQTALGAVQMASNNDDLVTLRQQVTSPGGTTEQAVNTLEAGGIRELFLTALAAAKKRCAELSS